MEKVITEQDIWQGSKMQVLKTQVRVRMKNASMDNASTNLQRRKKQIQKKQVHENTVCCLLEKTVGRKYCTTNDIALFI